MQEVSAPKLVTQSLFTVFLEGGEGGRQAVPLTVWRGRGSRWQCWLELDGKGVRAGACHWFLSACDNRQEGHNGSVGDISQLATQVQSRILDFDIGRTVTMVQSRWKFLAYACSLLQRGVLPHFAVCAVSVVSVAIQVLNSCITIAVA